MAGDEPKDCSDEDIALFRAAVADVRPLDENRVAPRPAPPPPHPAATRADEARVMDELLSGPDEEVLIETGETLAFHREGIQHRLLQRLRRGQISVEAELDLHGMTTAMAREAVNAFLADARRRGRRCVRIVHGKGRGSPHGASVLKQKLNAWLPRCDDVLAYCSARPVDGGTGALYVLLRRG